MMNVYMICSGYVFHEWSDGMAFSPLIEDALVYPTLKGALKLLSMEFGEVEQLRSWSRISVRNTPTVSAEVIVTASDAGFSLMMTSGVLLFKTGAVYTFSHF